MVADGVPRRVALLAIGRRANDWFEVAASRLTIEPAWREPVASAEGVLTSRTMRTDTLAIARNALDPHGVLREKAFGRLLGPALLEWWSGRDLVR